MRRPSLHGALGRVSAWCLAHRVPVQVLLLAPVLIFLLVDASDAWARAGGGHSFGGGRRSSGGGGFRGSSRSFGGGSHGGGDGDAGLLIWLVFQHPCIGLPLLALVVGVALYGRHGARPSAPVVVHGTPASRPPDLARLREVDPAFSAPAFLDMARLVVTRAHVARGKGDLAPVEAFLTPEARASMLARPADGVHDVILGSTQLARVTWDRAGDHVRLHVRVEGNLTEGTQPLRIVEAWVFSRVARTPSPAPGALRSLGCPSCASPLERLLDGRCASCGTALDDDAYHWRVVEITPIEQERLDRLQLHLGGGIEYGTDMPTRMAPGLADAQRAFLRRHPEVHWAALRARFVETFLAIQRAWGEMRWDRARPHETDALFQQHRHWIERYRREGLRNRCEDVAVTDVVLCKVEHDMYYESVTVRIYARMRDWTEDRSGAVVGGSRTEPKLFSEYWTFLRTVGGSAAPRPDLHACPSCAAPLDRVGETGVCGACDSKITGGEFDWVLADIQQDEVYRG